MRVESSDVSFINTTLLSADIRGILESENWQLYRCTGTIVAELQ